MDVYGNRYVKTADVLSVLPAKQGDSISRDNFRPDELSVKLKDVPGIKYASVSAVCCDTANNLMLYIGVGENDDCTLKLRPAPVQDIHLPADIMTAYDNYNAQLDSAVMKGKGQEDDAKGYAWSNYAPARAEQEKFVQYASTRFSVLLKVLKNAGSERQRAAAAQIIAYAPDKKDVVKALLPAVQDTSDEVRNNATRALSILANYSNVHPAFKLTIPAEPFIKMVNSIVWTDRNKGAAVLLALSRSKDQNVLHAIRRGALPAIIEMAKWQDRPHAFFSFFILGHLAGIEDEQLAKEIFSANWLAAVDTMVRRLE